MNAMEAQRVADCAYLAALYDLWGRINIHEYAERDGRWYLDVTILEPAGVRLPFDFVKRNFGGRLGTVRKDEKLLTVWRAVGPRAYDVLSSIRPYVIGNLATLDYALATFQDDVIEEEEE